jgi:hypothetical protein
VSKIAVRALLLAMVLTALPAATGQYEVLAVPVTVSDHVEVPLPDAAEAADDVDGVVAQGLDVAADAVSRTPVVAAPMPFSMVGFELPDGVDDLRVRTSVDGEEWTEWVDTERVEPEDGPDPETAEAEGDRSQSFAEPVWVEEANYLQVELPEGVDADGSLRAEVIDSLGIAGQDVERKVVPSGPDAADAVDRPQIISRAGWGADESWRSGSPSRASNVHMGVVHHTATSNTYSDARAVMRSMYSYHTRTLGWSDLGYNIVVDQQGNVYEGRAGGLESGVIGAHARGYNTGSFGVSVIGNFEHVEPPRAALRALERVIAWQSTVYGIDPEGTTTAGGSRISTIVGHRQVGNTACPGRIQNHLPALRTASADQVRAASIPFPDVTNGHREAVLALADAGIINGCAANRFCPARGLTRGQMSSMLARALDLSPSGGGDRFSDVPSSHPHRDGIHALVDADVVDGYDDGTFRPEAELSRDQMATFLTNALGLDKRLFEARFTDVTPINPHAQAIEAVAREEITLGCNSSGSRYCPRDTLRRDQTASLLHRGLPAGVVG